MILVYYEKVGEDKGRYTGRHNEPNTLPSEEITKGILVDFIAEPENNGKAATLYCKPSTGELYYEYTDPLPQPEIEQLKNDLTAVQDIINSFVLGL